MCRVWQSNQVYGGPGTGKCTICGGGMNSLLEVYNPSACQSSNKLCSGFTFTGTVGRGLLHNCTSGPGTCCPGVVAGDGEALPGPTTPDDYCIFEVPQSPPPPLSHR